MQNLNFKNMKKKEWAGRINSQSQDHLMKLWGIIDSTLQFNEPGAFGL